MPRGCSDRRAARSAGNERSDRQCDRTTEECPYQPSIVGRFNPTEVKCGDNAELQAEATNIDDGTDVSFSLKKLSDDQNIATESAPLDSSQVRRLQWESQKPTDDWPEWEVGFEVSASGASSESENNLKFHHYTNQASETRTERMSSPPYGWTKKYDIKFEDGIIIINVKIKLLNMQGPRPSGGAAMPAVGAAVSDEDKEEFKDDIEGQLSEKWIFHRQDCNRDDECDCPESRKCCKFKVRIQVQFVASGEHHEVKLFQGTGQANSAEWFRVPSWPTSYAHETGHLLGWFDEYSGGATGSNPWHVQSGVIMSSDGPDVPNYYYNDFKAWFTTKTSENWTPIEDT